MKIQCINQYNYPNNYKKRNVQFKENFCIELSEHVCHKKSPCQRLLTAMHNKGMKVASDILKHLGEGKIEHSLLVSQTDRFRILLIDTPTQQALEVASPEVANDIYGAIISGQNSELTKIDVQAICDKLKLEERTCLQ